MTPSNTDTTVHPWDVAVVYESLAMQSCGHRLVWNRHNDVPQMCPLCQAPIVLICDEATAAITNKNSKSQMESVFFKYNKQSFLLSLRNPKRLSWFDRRLTCLAQERIAYALGMNEKNGLKILCKGKVLYPNPSRTLVDSSKELANISQTDVDNHNKKASLVVMGTREGQGLHEPPRALGGFFHSLFAMSTSILYTVVYYMWNSVLYLYSYVKPLPPPDEERRRRRD